LISIQTEAASTDVFKMFLTIFERYS